MSRNPELNEALNAAWEELEEHRLKDVRYINACFAYPEHRIAERVAALYPADLAPAVMERERLGFFKYGQFLDQNHQPAKAKAVHAVQELMDFCNYSIWLGLWWPARIGAYLAVWLCRRYHLSAWDIVDGGKR